MKNGVYSLRQLDCDGEEDFCSSLMGFESSREIVVEDTDHLLDYVFKGERHLDGMYSDMLLDATQSVQESAEIDAGLVFDQKQLIPENQMLLEHKEKALASHLSSFDLLNRYKIRPPILDEDKQYEYLNKASWIHELSTEEVMRVSAASYIQISGPKDEGLLTLTHPFSSLLSVLPEEGVKNVELVCLLLSSAEKVDHCQYEQAHTLLTHCQNLSSNVGNSVQRVVHYFVEALQERIGRETGAVIKARLREFIDEAMLIPHPALVAFHQMLPFSQVLQFTATQAIIDNVATATRVHVIDLGIRIGMHWTILLQALANRSRCPIKLLKISAVGTSREKIDETGKRLASFAKTLNLPFRFNAVIVSDISYLKKDQLGIETGEVVVVYVPCILRKMIFRPESLEKIMRTIRNINPCLMTVTDIEANHNSPSFINRFIQALFFYGAWFDCIGTCMAVNDSDRMSMEAGFFRQGIRSMIATEGNDRVIRHVGIDIWRSFFYRFGFIEIPLSQQALYQAKMIIDQFACGHCCTFDLNEKVLTVGWKKTPFMFVSAWRMHW